jgi:hypothetical protein
VLGIFKIGSHELFAGLASNLDPSDLCLLSSWDLNLADSDLFKTMLSCFRLEAHVSNMEHGPRILALVNKLLCLPVFM